MSDQYYVSLNDIKSGGDLKKFLNSIGWTVPKFAKTPDQMTVLNMIEHPDEKLYFMDVHDLKFFNLLHIIDQYSGCDYHETD